MILAMPWFGMDIGGTLTKLIYFEPDYLEEIGNDHQWETIKTIHRYLIGQTAYGQSGVRDKHLEIRNVRMGGRDGSLHFIRFPTADMQAFIELAKSKNFGYLARTICASGGGAFKFEEDFKRVSFMPNLYRYVHDMCSRFIIFLYYSIYRFTVVS